MRTRSSLLTDTLATQRIVEAQVMKTTRCHHHHILIPFFAVSQHLPHHPIRLHPSQAGLHSDTLSSDCRSVSFCACASSSAMLGEATNEGTAEKDFSPYGASSEQRVKINLTKQ